MDGQESLWNAAQTFLPDVAIIEILDLLHACIYVWKAAHLFFKKKSKAASRFAKENILRILRGEVDRVIRGLRWKGTHEKLSKKRLEDLEKICGYFENNRHRMAYDEYLEAGYPIASGVIEGARRQVVKDRMERSGMRSYTRWSTCHAGPSLYLLGGSWESCHSFLDQTRN